MPRLPINYQNTYFYKIVCKDLSVPDSYVGHTTDFTKRRADHKKRSNNLTSTALPVHRFIHNNGGWDNFDMILIERRTCQDKLEACKFERGHIEDLNATLNAHMPSRTKNTMKRSENIPSRKWRNILKTTRRRLMSGEIHDLNANVVAHFSIIIRLDTTGHWNIKNIWPLHQINLMIF